MMFWVFFWGVVAWIAYDSIRRTAWTTWLDEAKAAHHDQRLRGPEFLIADHGGQVKLYRTELKKPRIPQTGWPPKTAFTPWVWQLIGTFPDLTRANAQIDIEMGRFGGGPPRVQKYTDPNYRGAPPTFAGMTY